MAIYHLNERGVSPAGGSSAVRSSAYQSGEALTDERTGELADYGRKSRVAAAAVELPAAAPEWARGRGALWNAATAAWAGGTELVARRVECALPRELGLADQVSLVRAFAARETARGHAVDWAIHDAEDGNPHAHLLISALPIGKGGFERPAEPRTVKVYLCRDVEGLDVLVRSTDWRAAKASGCEKVFNFKDGERRTLSEAAELGLTKADRKSANPVSMNADRASGLPSFDAERARLAADRAAWAALANAALERAGSEARIDHRSNRERGLEAVPTVHEGPEATAIERRSGADSGGRRAAVTGRRLINEAIRRLNDALRAIADGAGRAAASAVVTARDWWVRRANVEDLRRWGVSRRAGIARARARATADRSRGRKAEPVPERPMVPQGPSPEALAAELRSADVARREAELRDVTRRRDAAMAAAKAERAAYAAREEYKTLGGLAKRGARGKALIAEAERQEAEVDRWKRDTGQVSPAWVARDLDRAVDDAAHLVRVARELPDEAVLENARRQAFWDAARRNAPLSESALAARAVEPASEREGRGRSRGR